MCRFVVALSLAIAVAVSSSASSKAAVPESTIKAQQDSAPEALEITVVSVTQSTQAQAVPGYPGCTRTVRELTVNAKVDVVRRSASGLQPGQTVAFNSTVISTFPCVFPGVNVGQMVNVGDQFEAYLRPGAGATFAASDLQRLH
jgi:hypothetical protein